MRAIVKAIAAALTMVVAIPLVLTVLYGFVNPPSLPVMRRQAAGETVAQMWVPLSAISPNLVRAVVMAEDARFCLHWGVDLRQIRLVIEEALDGEEPRGASTITMQVVKNLFLWPRRSYLRKAVEVPLALFMDLALSKERILEIYLNTAQWGERAYGVEAGARTALRKSAADLTDSEAAAMATMLPAPAVRNPRAPTRRQQAGMNHVRRELDRAPWVFTCLPERIRP